jgi:hypothetical protein
VYDPDVFTVGHSPDADTARAYRACRTRDAACCRVRFDSPASRISPVRTRSLNPSHHADSSTGRVVAAVGPVVGRVEGRVVPAPNSVRPDHSAGISTARLSKFGPTMHPARIDTIKAEPVNRDRPRVGWSICRMVR